jgi:hypothetical protein
MARRCSTGSRPECGGRGYRAGWRRALGAGQAGGSSSDHEDRELLTKSLATDLPDGDEQGLRAGGRNERPPKERPHQDAGDRPQDRRRRLADPEHIPFLQSVVRGLPRHNSQVDGQKRLHHEVAERTVLPSDARDAREAKAPVQEPPQALQHGGDVDPW